MQHGILALVKVIEGYALVDATEQFIGNGAAAPGDFIDR
jgi:hypothetical protein